jgi:hypothetical protein
MEPNNTAECQLASCHEKYTSIFNKRGHISLFLLCGHTRKQDRSESETAGRMGMKTKGLVTESQHFAESGSNAWNVTLCQKMTSRG